MRRAKAHVEDLGTAAAHTAAARAEADRTAWRHVDHVVGLDLNGSLCSLCMSSSAIVCVSELLPISNGGLKNLL